MSQETEVRFRGSGRQEAVIGTDPRCDIVVHDDPYVSARHAKVVRAVETNPVTGTPGVFEVFDLASTNGTWVLRRQQPLKVDPGGFITLMPGDIICVGRSYLPWTGQAQ